MRGIVTKSTGSWYEVECEDGLSLKCRLRGRLRLEGVRTTNPLAVGDIVTLEYEGAADAGRGVITALEPRRNYIIRRSTNLSKESHIIAANIDTLFLVATLDFPPVSLEFIDRFLVTARVYHVPVTIVLNKMDMFDDERFRPFVDNFRSIYERAGYRVVECSAREGRGTDVIKEIGRAHV